MKKLSVLFAVILVVFFFGAKAYWDFLQSPVDTNAQMKVFVIKKGESMNSVTDRLKQEGIIRSGLAFKAALKAYPNVVIQAGDYKLSGAMSLKEVISNMTNGPNDKWVTLLEGWRVEEIAEELNQKLNIKNQKFIELAKFQEGYLFPDTYLFNQDVTVETIIATMRANFDRKYDEQLQVKIKSKGLTSEQGVILASLVEREARSDEVRTKVASIILKRLKMGMKLDIDATVRYAKDTQLLKSGKRVAKFWQGISPADYNSVISPYNTYLNNGLPPGPICNPSLSALKAVANADPNILYLFYYHDSKGNSYYAKTLEEHNANVATHR